MRNYSTFGLFLISALFACNAYPCGESLLHGEAAMHYRNFVSRSPADILIFQPAVAGNSADRQQLYNGLRKAGHKVTVVNQSDAFAQALAAHHYTLVIATAQDADAIKTQLGQGTSAAGAPKFLAVSENDDLTRYLKSIERVMHSA